MVTDQEWQDFREYNKKIRQRRQQEHRDLTALIRQRKAEDMTGCFILTFWARGYDGVAAVQVFDNTAKINRFTDIGPMGHYDVKSLDKLTDELREEGFRPTHDPAAGQMLDLWSNRQKWIDGIKAVQLKAAMDTLEWNGYRNEYLEIWQSRDLDKALKYCKEFGLKIL